MAKIKLALGLILLLSLLGSTFFISPAVTSPDEVKWSKANIPTEGQPGNWMLADGSDVQYLTMAIDGTLYCYASPTATDYTLYKSTDDGYTWSHIGKVKDTIVDIAPAPDDTSVIYYATPSDIYKSTDAGISFTLLATSPGGAGSNNIEITSIDVAPWVSNNIIAVGTRDTDNLQYGGIYMLDEIEPFTWIDTGIGSSDVYAVAFSPGFGTGGQLVAIVTDETDTFVTTRIGAAGWGEIISNATIEGLTPASAAIAFPSDYNSEATAGEYVRFVAIDTGSGNGDVYRVNSMMAPGNSTATDLNIGSAYGSSDIDVTALAVTGNATAANLLAGAASSTEVYFSNDGGINWTRSTKEPTGESETYVLMARDFSSRGGVYAATSGTESAFSISQDSGDTWNQVGLIDTSISDIVDLALSPGYSQDNTLFMLTVSGDGKCSLWRSLNGGTSWKRLYSSALAHVDSIDLVELSPQYGNGSQAVFIAGSSNGNPVIWKSTDNGQNFIGRIACDPTTATTITIDIWAVVNDTSLFVGSFDVTNNQGLVYHTTNDGLFYSKAAVVGRQSLNSIALSPNYEQDETILVGNTNGWVYWSNDNGISFEPLGEQVTQLIAEADAINDITVAFDPQFSTNNTVYAASHCYKGANHSSAIYRFITDTGAVWESIDSTLPDNSMLSQLIASADSTLYATDFQPVRTEKENTTIKKFGGMERCLNPRYPLGPKFETVTRGLDDGATLSGLWLCDNRLWSTDTTNTKLMTFTDSLALPVTPASPSDKAPGIHTRNVNLDWEALKGATSYKWQLDYDTDFSTVPEGFENDTEATSARLPALEPATTYYWRVRATKPVLSPWSDKWSFTTSLGSVVLGSTVIAPELYSPEAGASGVPLRPVFQWNAIAGADSYELLVSTDISFTNPTIIRIGAYALPATAWQCDIILDYDTTYYWKVRATGSDTHSAWSAVGAFTTESPPQESSSPPQESLSSPPPPSLPPPPSPPPPAKPTTPDWVNWLIYLGGALLVIMVIIVVTLIILTMKVSRL